MYFFDTCALLRLQEKVFHDYFLVSSLTFQELENIKTSRNKDEATKAKARSLLRLFKKNREPAGCYGVLNISNEQHKWLEEHGMPLSIDNLMIATAVSFTEIINSSDLVFATDDIGCGVMADLCGLKVEFFPMSRESENCYVGYKTVSLADEDYLSFTAHLGENRFELLVNQYLLILDTKGDIVDILRWDGIKHVEIFKKNLRATPVGVIKPKDEQQMMAIDSIIRNSLTLITGQAGSGKSYLAFFSALYLVETGKYGKIIIMTNPTKTRGAADLGYYKGTLEEKLLCNSIGEMLASKLGDRYSVENMMADGKLKIISMADCRGFEAENAIVYITEAQNTNVDLLKLCLSRVGNNCKTIIEGDYDSQVDSGLFEGDANGLKRAIDTFKGNPLTGIVHLHNVWRSEIAKMADLL